jgi:hypothetical protein
MKKFFNLCFFTWITATAMGQVQHAINLPSPTPYTIVSRDANSRVWEKTTYEVSPSGEIVPQVHRYTELGTGLCYQQNGQWVDSQEQINLQPDGTASATQGQHQAYFPADIGNGVIKLITADGVELQSQPTGLFYDDGSNTVFFAELTNSMGQLIDANQVIYTNAFAGIDADLLYTFRKSGFEQDVIFREQPPTPEQFGLSSANTRIQLLTEFFDTPAPTEMADPVGSQDGLRDTTLTFGAMEMTHGRAFLGSLSNRSHNLHDVPVYKSWTTVDGRSFLVEQVPYPELSSQLGALPAANAVSLRNSILNKVSAKRLLPPIRPAKKVIGSIQLTKNDTFQKRGVILDYFLVNSNYENFTFQADTTYYLTNGFTLGGTVTFEGGTVIKCGDEAGLFLDSFTTVNCQTGPYRPAIFTSVNDNTVGEQISGSTGTPTFQDDVWDLWIAITNFDIHDCRFSYASGGIIEYFTSGATINLTNCQFMNEDVAVQGANLGLYNVLIGCNSNILSQITNSDDADEAQVYLESTNFTAENVTADNGYAFIEADDPSATLAMTNCLVTRQPLLSSYGYTITPLSNAVVCLPSSSTQIYQPVGSGNYYLTNGSAYRGVGTANIDQNLLTDLAQKTTYPPTVFSNTTIPYATNFMPQAQRDNSGENVDLGYHYDPIDYVFGGVSALANLSFTNGTVMGWFGSSVYGIALSNSVSATFNGTATSPCVDAHYTTVQEGGNQVWADYGSQAGILANGTIANDTNISSIVNAQFTHFMGMTFEAQFCRDYTSLIIFNARNCEFNSGSQGAYGIHDNFTNCLFNGTPLVVQADLTSVSALIMENCTMRESYILTSHWSGATWPVWITNSAYDGTDLSQMDSPSGGSSYIQCDYNAFVTNDTQLPFEGSHTVIVTNYNWESSWLGNYYLPTNSLLINAGNTTADQLGLYHFTTQTNQVPETNSIVDIGYHYVATDDNGNPLDSNGDGVPDYLEDAAGNGSGNWDTTLFLNVIITQPRNGSTLP